MLKKFKLSATLATSTLAAISLGLTGCTDSGSQKGDWLKWGIFGNRPITSSRDLMLITLNSPALLASATPTATGGLQISEKAKQEVLAEQAAFEAKLNAEFPNVPVIYRYRLTLNAITVFASPSEIEQIQQLPHVKKVASSRPMARPQAVKIQVGDTPGIGAQKVNSVNFIGADQAHKLGFTGKGLRVGVIDSGIDYTHSMLGGPGKAEIFKSLDPAQPSNLFPNDKVLGGLDLVGTEFDPSSNHESAHRPHPDSNPLDEGGHGTHVAGTIAGIGNGNTTYSGVAPDASLYAIKVFGKDGSTSDAVVIAGFEFAMDPNGDLNIDDQLDVVNLSLGSGFGQPQALYNEAIRNVTRGGTVVVASAGNSGDISYIVGAPSTTDAALSVAASIDGSDVNWRFAASQISGTSTPDLFVEAVEGPISRPVAISDGIAGELVDIGFGDAALSEEVKNQLNGKVAFIQRGKVSFADKLSLAKSAGAIGAVVYNNEPTKPFPMGGEAEPIDMPAIMITQAIGQQILQDLAKGPVSIQFKTNRVIEKPELIDTITDFSSRGPRSEDNLFKPEISAPGQNITSAEMGGGDTGIKMDGTSMAGPHVAGAMALIKQAHPHLSVAQLKALAMNTAKPLTMDRAAIPMTAQGAGRIQLLEAVNAKVISETAALSLGGIQLGAQKSDSREITLRNLSNQPITLKVLTVATPGLTLTAPSTVTVPALSTTDVTVQARYDLQNIEAFMVELNGRILFTQNDQILVDVPAMAIRTQASEIQIQSIGTQIQLKNASAVTGIAVAFNLLGEDNRKKEPLAKDAWMGRGCDLKSAGYRIIRVPTPQGPLDIMQFAFKMQDVLTTWTRCSISVLIDADGDGIEDQELAGVTATPLEGITPPAPASLLLDSMTARQVRAAFELDIAMGKQVKEPDYTPALLGTGSIANFDQSTFAMLEMPVALLAQTPTGKIRVKVAAQAEGGEDVEADDFLGEGLGNWIEISPNAAEHPYQGMSDFSEVTQTGATLDVRKGSGTGKLVLYFPVNQATGANGTDGQQTILEL